MILARISGQAGLSGYLGWVGRSWWASIPGQAPGPPPCGCSFLLVSLGFLAAWWSQESEVSQRVKCRSCRRFKFRLGSYMILFLPYCLGQETHRAHPDSREGEKDSFITGAQQGHIAKKPVGQQSYLFPSWETNTPHNLSLPYCATLCYKVPHLIIITQEKKTNIYGILPHVDYYASHFHIEFLTCCDLYFKMIFPRPNLWVCLNNLLMESELLVSP